MYVDEGNIKKEVKPGSISLFQAVAIIVGMVIGPGIFKTPSIVASNSGSETAVLLLWFAGGIISFIGALCYAELTSTYPHAGGEYHYLARSFSKKIAFLFAWGRMTVIQTGSIAMLAFIIGDYAGEAFNFGSLSRSIFAVGVVVFLTVINIWGIKPSSKAQTIMFAGMLIGLTMIIISGLAYGNNLPESNSGINSDTIVGHAMIFVLLTYGGWNEAAYLSAEVGRKPVDTAKVLFFSLAAITIIYLAMNLSFINGLGLKGVSNSEAVASDLAVKNFGNTGAQIISIIVAIAAFTTINAVMITGARTNYALGKDFPLFSFLAKWNHRGPAAAYLFQSGIALLLIFFGSLTRDGFVTMVEFTSPVFWFFFLMVGTSVIILRIKDPERTRYFKVPFYPVTPLLFCAAAAFMLYSSLKYTAEGAIVGVLILLSGVPFLFIKKNKKT